MTTDRGATYGATTDQDLYGSSNEGTTGTTDKAKAAASTAADQGKHVAGTAKDEAANVAGTAKEQARTVVHDATQQVRSQVTDQATTQRDRLSETLRTFGDDLDKMASGEGAASGMAADLVREVSERARSFGSHLQDREPAQLLDEARDFARRRPGTFLLGALAAGVVAGRLFRATADGAAAASLAEQPTGTPGYGTTGTGTAGYGTTGTTGTTGTGTMGTASGAAPLTGYPADTSTDRPGYTGGDALDPHPTLTHPASTDPTTSGVPGQRTQDTP